MAEESLQLLDLGNMPVRLGYWKIRGLASQIRYEMAHLGV